MTVTYNTTQLKPLRKVLRKHQTEAERVVWDLVRNRQILGLKFFRQYSVGNYILDFFCPQARLCIEIDGGQHAEPLKQIVDIERTRYLQEQNVTEVRFWNNEVLKNTEGVYDKLYETLARTKLS
jgi:very-short-patch-repair endonuclease